MFVISIAEGLAVTKLLFVVEAAISRERLAPYRDEADGSIAAAVKLYEWNAAMSAALWQDIGHLEVLLRNAMHDQLTAWNIAHYGNPRWYDDPGNLLAAHRREDIAMARSRLARANKPDDPGRIVAELSFGFWRYLASAQYDRTLWRDALHQGFPGRKRSRLYDHLVRLHALRNRLAHHEPIHHVPLRRRHDEILTIAGWINPVLRGWVERQSQTPTVLDQRPVR